MNDNLNKNRQFRLRDLLLGQKPLWLIAWLLGIATVLSVLGLVMLSGWFITMAGVAGVLAVGSHTFNYLMPSAIIRGFAITRTAARYGDLMVSHHAVFGLLKDLRVRFFSDWAKLPLAVRIKQGGHSSADTMQRLVRDIDVLDEFPLRVVSPFVVATVAVGLLCVAVAVVLPSAVMAVVCMVLSLAIAAMTLWRGIAFAKQENHLASQRKSTLINTLPALTSLLTWGRWGDQVAQMTRLDDAHHAISVQTMRHRRQATALIQGLIALAVVVLLWAAGQVFAGGITPFTLDNLNAHTALNPAIMLALTLGVFGLMEIVSVLIGEPLALGRSLDAKARINRLISDDVSFQKQPISNNPTITLRDLSVKMPSAIVGASNINATLTPAKPMLIVGASGVGKSTLLATLAGEIPHITGDILVDGIDINQVDFGQSFGFLGQSVDIFDQTLADNLRLGKPSATDDELWAVLDKVNLSHWAKSQPKGLDTPLGEYGMAISGGQARRVALARLLLSPKKVLLLDEPFAGLDGSTRQQVWQALIHLQNQGDIGVLAIATHQIGKEMNDVDVLSVV